MENKLDLCISFVREINEQKEYYYNCLLNDQMYYDNFIEIIEKLIEIEKTYLNVIRKLKEIP